MTEPRALDVAGRTMRARVGGPAEEMAGNPPLLLLHGIGRSLADWNEQHELLEDRFRVISMDLPGFGYSAPRPVAEGAGTLAAMADGVAATLDALGEHRPVTVIGNSLGGAVALHLLASHPDRVARLVLVDSAGFGAQVTWLLRLLTVPGLGVLARRTTRMSVRLAERAIFVDRALADHDRLALAIELGHRPGGDRFMHALARELGTPLRGVRASWRHELLAAAGRYPRPTLVVWGSDDRILPSRHLAAALAAFPHAEASVFPGVGHMPQIERPREFADRVVDFVEHS